MLNGGKAGRTPATVERIFPCVAVEQERNVRIGVPAAEMEWSCLTSEATMSLSFASDGRKSRQ
jgi:hypothetical protein